MEMKIATNIQKTLLKTDVPQLASIDIGMISIPNRKMTGDYVHFYNREDYLSVAVTDVVGKGVPAALCMSMVKYGLETLEYAYKDPSYVLEVINRVIEKSVDDSMFVSMFYGCLDMRKSIFLMLLQVTNRLSIIALNIIIFSFGIGRIITWCVTRNEIFVQRNCFRRK